MYSSGLYRGIFMLTLPGLVAWWLVGELTLSGSSLACIRCVVFCGFCSGVFVSLDWLLYVWPPSACWCLLALLVAAARFVTQLQSLDRRCRYVVRNGQEVREIGAPLGTVICYFHTSSSAALSTRPPGSSDWTGSVTVSGWNRLRCCFYYILRPLPSPLLSNSLAGAPAGYLFVMGFSHLSLSSSSLQPESLSAWMEASFTCRGFMDFWQGACASKQQVEDKNPLHTASSSLNHIQMNGIFFLTLQGYALVCSGGANFLSSALQLLLHCMFIRGSETLCPTSCRRFRPLGLESSTLESL